MTINDLIRLCQARIVNLSSLRTAAEQLGDVDRVATLDNEIGQTQSTLLALTSIEVIA